MDHFLYRNPLWLLVDIIFIGWAISTGNNLFIFLAIIDFIWTLVIIFMPDTAEKILDNIFVRLILGCLVVVVILYVLQLIATEFI